MNTNKPQKPMKPNSSQLSPSRWFARAAVLLTLASGSLVGGLQAQDFEGKNISALEIKYSGPKTVDEATLRKLIDSKAGTAFSSERLDADVKALFKSGSVDDVVFLAEPDGDSVRLIAEITTPPAKADNPKKYAVSKRASAKPRAIDELCPLKFEEYQAKAEQGDAKAQALDAICERCRIVRARLGPCRIRVLGIEACHHVQQQREIANVSG